jgi:hypothetical protein
VRALEPVLAEARGRGARSIVTGGRHDSNWATLAAAAAARLGLCCHCVLDPVFAGPAWHTACGGPPGPGRPVVLVASGGLPACLDALAAAR